MRMDKAANLGRKDHLDVGVNAIDAEDGSHGLGKEGQRLHTFVDSELQLWHGGTVALSHHEVGGRVEVASRGEEGGESEVDTVGEQLALGERGQACEAK